MPRTGEIVFGVFGSRALSKHAPKAHISRSAAVFHTCEACISLARRRISLRRQAPRPGRVRLFLEYSVPGHYLNMRRRCIFHAAQLHFTHAKHVFHIVPAIFHCRPRRPRPGRVRLSLEYSVPGHYLNMRRRRIFHAALLHFIHVQHVFHIASAIFHIAQAISYCAATIFTILLPGTRL